MIKYNRPTTTVVPIHEPEILGSGEKASDTALKEISCGDATLISRYQRSHEYQMMIKIMVACEADYRGHIRNMFFDSKGHTLEIVVWPCLTGYAEAIGKIASETELYISIFVIGMLGVEDTLRVTQRLEFIGG